MHTYIIHTRMYTYIRLHMYIHTRMYTYIHLHMYIHTSKGAIWLDSWDGKYNIVMKIWHGRLHTLCIIVLGWMASREVTNYLRVDKVPPFHMSQHCFNNNMAFWQKKALYSVWINQRDKVYFIFHKIARMLYGKLSTVIKLTC